MASSFPTHTSRRDLTAGFGAMLLAITLFSTIEVVSKWMGPAVPPLRLAFLRFFITGLVLLIPAFNILRMRMEPLGARDMLILAGLGAVGVALSIGLYHMAIHHLQANVAAIVFSANPVFVVLFSPWILGERVGWRKLLGVMIGLSGIAVFAVEKGGLAIGTGKGILLMLGAEITFALYSVLSKKFMPQYGAIVITCFAGLIGSLVLLPVSLALEGNPFAGMGPWIWCGVLYLAVGATAVAYIAYFYGLLNVGAARGSMFFFLKPVLASVFAWIVLSEPVTAKVVTGTLLILGSLFLSLLPGNRKPVMG